MYYVYSDYTNVFISLEEYSNGEYNLEGKFSCFSDAKVYASRKMRDKIDCFKTDLYEVRQNSKRLRLTKKGDIK